MIRIPRRVVDEISSDVVKRYPEEACGLLIGRLESGVRLVSRYTPVKNSYLGERNRRYLIDPMEYMRIDDEVSSRGEMIVGVYHSHPDAPALPSSFDNQQAVPFLSYVILSVLRGRVVEISAWLLDEVSWKLERDKMEILD
ncbi:MAG: M67 family metallopeptidase [Nitrososphaerota archaeon]